MVQKCGKKNNPGKCMKPWKNNGINYHISTLTGDRWISEPSTVWTKWLMGLMGGGIGQQYAIIYWNLPGHQGLRNMHCRTLPCLFLRQAGWIAQKKTFTWKSNETMWDEIWTSNLLQSWIDGTKIVTPSVPELYMVVLCCVICVIPGP